ncbi:YcbK family protein [Roseomonas fluvialis]|uniref:Murein endopeptidase K n=1 Tax=Roseomonas fluvialis TaxID=1750527 RepID=A0ABN6P7C8_9PROT|nr:DUF882 domain-containing protein [Roseomonas fluvialis]BDG73280.1 hypothetical protein Rmf_32090 [Roseomonas fluvialis]
MREPPGPARLRRRLLLTALPVAAAGAARADPAPAAEPVAPQVLDMRSFAQQPPVQDRHRWIWIQNEAREEVAVAYRTGQDYDIRALARLQHLFRDLRANIAGPLPPLLLDMLSLIQERFNYARPIRLISGYRTPATNASLPFAAPNSLHMRGMAADIVVPGLSQADVCSLAMMYSQHLGFMGVGWYGSFTHVDIGPKASWSRML